MNVRAVSAAVGCCAAGGFGYGRWLVRLFRPADAEEISQNGSRPWQKQCCAEANYAPGLETSRMTLLLTFRVDTVAVVVLL